MPDASVDAIVCDPPYELGFMGKRWDSTGIAYSVDLWREALRVLKPGGHLLAFGGTRTYHRMACAIEDAGFEIRDSIHWMYGSGFPKSLSVEKNGAGEAWKGWGTALKPAHEPVVMARKPLDGTVAANVLAHGTGAINVDGCRVGTDSTRTRHTADMGYRGGLLAAGAGYETGSASGRWPANVLLSHAEGCADECADGCPVAELGDAARYYYCAKPSTSERDAGLEHMPVTPGHEVCDREDGSAGADNPRAGVRTERRNTHPTVKPIAIMRYLVRLVTPPGGVVLDPFAGSGTTGCAAVLEGARFLGLELEPKHAEIARARIAHWAAQVPKQGELWRVGSVAS